MTTGKTIALTRQTFVGKVMYLLFSMLSRLVIAFLPRSKCLLISWLQSPSAVILEPKKIKSDTVSIVLPSICYEVMGPDAMILVSWMLSFKPTFSVSSFTFIKRLFSSSSLYAIRVVSSAYLILLIINPAIFFFIVSLFIYLFIFIFYLAALGLSCSMRDLVPWPGIEPGPPALGAQSPSHWTTREVPTQQSWFQLVLHPVQHFAWCTLHVS